MLKKIVSLLLQILLIIFLTALTQIGGFLWIWAWIVTKYAMFVIRKSKKTYFFYFKLKLYCFLVLYFSFTILFVPNFAKIYADRVPLPIFEENNIKPTTIWTCILNRHYVKPKLKEALFRIGTDFNKKYPTSKVGYLDANFPFYDGFPLLPHISHNDGKKIDLSFFYLDKETQEATDKKPSFSGYGIYEEPQKGEINQAKICLEGGNWQYEVGKYAKIYSNKEDYSFDKERTNYLVTLIIKEQFIKKFFLEPHLKNRFKISSPKWRFHGCRAARHDDHVHIQL